MWNNSEIFTAYCSLVLNSLAFSVYIFAVPEKMLLLYVSQYFIIYLFITFWMFQTL